jgi:hypothetical protein
MKKIFKTALIALSLVVLISCDRVAPNYYGVLMENYGKSKDDYSRVEGRVNIAFSAGTELFQVPAWEQRAKFSNDDGSDRILNLKASDNTAFFSKPIYSYKVSKDRAVDVVFQNARLGSGEDFLRAVEDNVLEPRIYDIVKEESRRYTTETLMATGGSLTFEQKVQEIVKTEFAKAGLELISFSLNLDFSKKVKDKIDNRNEVNTNISVLDQQIAEQRKRNELEMLKAEQNIIKSRGLTPEILELERIKTWNGVLPSTFSSGQIPFMKGLK